MYRYLYMYAYSENVYALLHPTIYVQNQRLGFCPLGFCPHLQYAVVHWGFVCWRFDHWGFVCCDLVMHSLPKFILILRFPCNLTSLLFFYKPPSPIYAKAATSQLFRAINTFTCCYSGETLLNYIIIKYICLDIIMSGSSYPVHIQQM